MQLPRHADVLIVGAGPTGLMLANQLARRNINVLIIDRHTGPAQQTRAMAVHARTLEIYAQLGIAETAVARGIPTRGVNLWASGVRKARIPFEDMGKGMSPFPYVLMLGQDENERILGERLRASGVSVHWNTAITSLEQRGDSVVATLERVGASSSTITAQWVAGCDGGHSFVREHAGIAFPGNSYEQTFFVADTTARGSMIPGELNVYLWQEGFHLFFPMRGTDGWRVVGILPAGLDPAETSFRDVSPHVRDAAGTDLEFGNCHWFSVYRIHHRRAEQFRAGRCFVLGDAAHVHSPMGGQGMNTGLQDAYNLAWKLALVVQGAAQPSLLDSYASERIQVAQTLLDSTDRLFTAVVADSWAAKLFRTQIMARTAALAMRRERIRNFAFRTISQIGIEYRNSSLSANLEGAPAKGPRAGDRFPWLELEFADGHGPEDVFTRIDDRRFNLIVSGQILPIDARSKLANHALIHAVRDNPATLATLATAHISGPAFYLLRPDGHVALAGSRLDISAIQQWFRARGIH